MMKPTHKQEQEIDFLCKFFGGQRSLAVEEDYILATTQGKRLVDDKFSDNPLRVAKTKLDRNIKMWRMGLEEGTFFPWELEDEFSGHSFGAKVVRSTVESTHKWQHYYSDRPLAVFAHVVREHV